MKNLLLLCFAACLFLSCQQANENKNVINLNSPQEIEVEYHVASIFPSKAKTSSSSDTNVWLESLITATPQEGRELAIKMARQTIGAVQSDPEIKRQLREKYAEDYAQLINISKVVAIEFQTIAEANNYWRK